MSYLTVFKTAFKAATGGTTLYLYGALIAVGAVAVGSAFLWHGAQVREVRDTAFSAGRMEVESATLRETQRELTRMVGITNNLNEVAREQLETIGAAERAAALADERVRQLTAQRAAAIRTAPADAVRGYATVAGDVYAACREEYRALGFDAERCSVAAHTLNGYAEAVSSRPSRPTPPTPPSKP